MSKVRCVVDTPPYSSKNGYISTVYEETSSILWFYFFQLIARFCCVARVKSVRGELGAGPGHVPSSRSELVKVVRCYGFVRVFLELHEP